jgi:DNA-directed RNA polymerase subunit RPC12/RpoP
VARDPLVENHLVEMICSRCTTTFEMPIRQVRLLQHTHCPECGHIILLGTSRIKAQIARIEKSVAGMRSELKRSQAAADAGTNQPNERGKPGPRRR